MVRRRAPRRRRDQSNGIRPAPLRFDAAATGDLWCGRAERSTGVMDIAIVGGGITGLSLALNLHSRGLSCRVFERAPEIRELGVGITLLPHAMREFAALGLQDEL
jgi:NADPH-dependent 2,4-dienoyl-CoA reductase/sulfur reductase-like enzyme